MTHAVDNVHPRMVVCRASHAEERLAPVVGGHDVLPGPGRASPVGSPADFPHELQVVPGLLEHVMQVQLGQVLVGPPAAGVQRQQAFHERFQRVIARDANHALAAHRALRPPVACAPDPTAEASAAKIVQARLHAGRAMQHLLADHTERSVKQPVVLRRCGRAASDMWNCCSPLLRSLRSRRAARAMLPASWPRPAPHSSRSSQRSLPLGHPSPAADPLR